MYAQDGSSQDAPLYPQGGAGFSNVPAQDAPMYPQDGAVPDAVMDIGIPGEILDQQQPLPEVGAPDFWDQKLVF